MRVLMVNKYARFVGGGAELHCLDLAGLLRERGHDVTFLSTADPDNAEKGGAFVPLTVSHDSRRETGNLAGIAVGTTALWNRSAAAATRHAIASFRPDVVHVHKLYPQLSVAPVVEASRAGVAVVQTLHDYELISASAIDASGRWLDSDERSPRYRALNSATYPVRRIAHRRSVTKWIAVSKAVASVYAAHGIDARAITNFPTAAAGGHDSPPPFGERKGMLFVGRLTHEKGIDHVVGAAEALGPDVPVTVIGAGPLSGEVDRAAERLPNLQHSGPTDRRGVAHALRRARVALMPSRWEEPGALTALEAMVNGTPIAAYDRGGLGEYVRNAGAGAICAGESAEALTEAASCLYEDQGAWERASAGGLEAIETTHAPERHAATVEEVYREAVGS